MKKRKLKKMIAKVAESYGFKKKSKSNKNYHKFLKSLKSSLKGDDKPVIKEKKYFKLKDFLAFYFPQCNEDELDSAYNSIKSSFDNVFDTYGKSSNSPELILEVTEEGKDSQKEAIKELENVISSKEIKSVQAGEEKHNNEGGNKDGK